MMAVALPAWQREKSRANKTEEKLPPFIPSLSTLIAKSGLIYLEMVIH